MRFFPSPIALLSIARFLYRITPSKAIRSLAVLDTSDLIIKTLGTRTYFTAINDNLGIAMLNLSHRGNNCGRTSPKALFHCPGLSRLNNLVNGYASL